VITFEQRAGGMGLRYNPEKGLFSYDDDISSVVYRTLSTTGPSMEEDRSHETDNFQIPYYAVFTRPSNIQHDIGYRFVGMISRIYRFVGNRELINGVRQSIENVGLPIVGETNLMSWDYTRLRSEIVIRSGVENTRAGDVLPVMIVNNSYNGTRSQSIQFGFNINYNRRQILTYGFKLGEMKEIHVAGAQTYVSSSAQHYVQSFPQHIIEMIESSFNTHLTEDHLFATLDIIEKIGKKKRDEISKILSEMVPEPQDGQPPQLPSAWQVFLAIVRYSSFEPNLNVRSLLENAAERVLVIPTRMMELLNRLKAQAER